MPVPTPQTVAQLQALFVSSYIGTLDPNFGAVAANIPTGDPLLALAFATTALATTEQSAIQALYNFSRASTSTGSDLDSWLADFDFQRFQGSKAQASFNIPTSNGAAPSSPIVIPAGTVIQTQPIVLAPSTIPQVYSFATVSQVTITAPAASVNVTAQALAVGSNYNGIPTTTAFQLGSSITGVGNPTMTVAPAFGANAATDAQARAAFILYLASLELGTLQAITAAIEEVAPFQYGTNLAIYDYATNQSTAANVTLAQPGQVTSIIIESSKSGQYSGTPDDPIADSVLSAMKSTVAFGITPLLYYATQYNITAIGITFSYSAAALTNAGLTLTQLEALMTGVLQGFFPAAGGTAGGALGQQIFFSEIAQAMLNLTVTTGAGVVTGLVQDVNVPAVSIVTMLAAGISSPLFTGGTFTPSGALNAVYGGNPGLRDPTGYLTMATTLQPGAGLTYVPVQLP